MTNSQIAAELWVAPSTVKKHLENVYDKLGVNRRTAAAVMLSATD
jgi:DNA-binding CsgD family transcriptional regulator